MSKDESEKVEESKDSTSNKEETAEKEETLEITNYDVLADRLPEEEKQQPIEGDKGTSGTSSVSTSNEKDTVNLSLAKHNSHVGNNRFEVMCNIYRQQFIDFQKQGDEFSSASTVEKILEIVQNQCVPKGRFLECSPEGKWKEMDVADTRLLVRQFLAQQQQAMAQSSAAVQNESNSAADAAEKKRRRRSSLLRRSVSASMLPDFQKLDAINLDAIGEDDDEESESQSRPPVKDVDSKKKTSRADIGGAKTTRTFKVAPVTRMSFTMKKEMIPEPRQMDIILNQQRTGLIDTSNLLVGPNKDTRLYGNNRLRVMLTLEIPTYNKTNDPQEKSKIMHNLLQTIHRYWGGRVLVLAPASNGYEKIDGPKALKAMETLLENKPQPRPSITSSGKPSALGSFPSDTLPELPAELQSLRSAAVKSLQKRKQKQSLNSRIRNLTVANAHAAGITSATPVDLSGYRAVSSGASVASSAAMSDNMSVATANTTLHAGVGGSSVGRRMSVPKNITAQIFPAQATIPEEVSNAMNMQQLQQMQQMQQLQQMQQQQLLQQQQQQQQQMQQGLRTQRVDTEGITNSFTNVSVSNSVSSDGLPTFGQGELEFLMKNLGGSNDEMAHQARMNSLRLSGMSQVQPGMPQPGVGGSHHAVRPGQEEVGNSLTNISLANSTASDGLPAFGEKEMELLMKNLQ